jgi:sugar phosphate isomerase/epimerase
MNGSLALGTALFGFLYRASREEALRQIAEAGYELVELSATPPFLDLSDVGAQEQRRIKQDLERNRLKCVSINPVELNPITANRDLSEACHRQYRAAIELASALEARSIVMITGRRSPLIPVPEAEARDLLRAHLELLVPVAERLGVTLTLEPVPYGFLQTAAEVASFIRDTGMSELGITLDCANTFFAGADPAEEVRAVGELVKLVHISDSWRARWAHTQVGLAEIDFAAFARALEESAYAGPTIYELVDGDDPGPRLRADRGRLSKWGWSAPVAA